MERHTNYRGLQHATEPIRLVGWLQERVIAKVSRMLLFDEILDLADRFAGDLADSLDVLRNKQQAVRVNVPFFDEAARFLCASARVAGVHEAALVVHEAVNVSTGTGQALTKVLGRHFQNLSPGGICRAENLAEREDQPLLAIQTKQHAHRAAVLGFLHQNRQINGYTFPIRQVEIRRALDGGAVIRERRDLCLGAPTLHVENMVGDNAIEPGAELAFALERAELRDDLDQHLLGDFFGVLRLKYRSEER